MTITRNLLERKMTFVVEEILEEQYIFTHGELSFVDTITCQRSKLRFERDIPMLISLNQLGDHEAVTLVKSETIEFRCTHCHQDILR